MTSYFAIDYTIHFDDTMVYGGHHFLTAFKLQCASRESFLFGELIFDQPGVKEALEGVHLLTSDAYARNLQSMRLGDRVAILLTLEQWGRASARFCYRILDHRGERVCAGFQTLICADARTGDPQPLPTALSDAMNRLRDIEENRSHRSFRDIVLAGGQGLDELFGEAERTIAIKFLSDRYPRPAVVQIDANLKTSSSSSTVTFNPSSTLGDAGVSKAPVGSDSVAQAWAFSGQGAFDEKLFCQRLRRVSEAIESSSKLLDECEQATREYFGPAASDLFSANIERCLSAVRKEPGLSQVAILLQNIFGAQLWRLHGHSPSLMMGHSFGEIAAFQVAGCFDLVTAVRIVCLRHQAIERFAPAQCGLLAVFTERYRVSSELSFLGLSKVCIAGRNHDKQTIASGPRDQLERLQGHLNKLGIQATRIQSPTSFHHPDLKDAARHWYESMSQFSMLAPETRIYSPIGRRFVGPNDNLAGTLASQLLRPFDLQGALLDLAAMGIAQVVDCGSTGSLANLMTTAGQGKIDVCCVASLQKDTDVSSELNPRKAGPAAVKGHPHEMPREVVANRIPVVTIEALVPRSTYLDEDSQRLPLTVIVGSGCILPAGATSPEQLFESVTQQRIGLIDQRTLDSHWTEDFYSEKLVPDRSTSHLSGLVNNIDIVCPSRVDPEFFHSLTRTQKLFCIAIAPCLHGLRDAARIVCLVGATADGFEDQDAATSLVFAGIDPLARDVDCLMNTARSGYRTPHQAIQFVLDHMVVPGVQLILVDAACASSLYTTALGMRLLETDRADAVIVGGVFCPGPGNSCLFSQFRGTTSTGCRPFDANADGVVFSEGAAILTLRRATDASRLGLKADAVVRGAGLSSDGRSSSANVPQSHGQILSLQRCYRRYSIDPASIAGIEGHGTSTPVGDSTEVETLSQFFAQHVTSPIPLHSLKGSIGHAGWAAGTASIIAACEYLHRQTFPAQGFFRKPSVALENAKSVLAVATLPTSLRFDQTRIAVDGFGFGGANAHLVIEKPAYDAAGVLMAPEISGSTSVQRETKAEDIVLIALHEIKPSSMPSFGNRFVRDAIKLPKDFIVLPELAEDMDISQTLTVLLVHQIIQDLPGFDANLRNETCVVLAMNGKTERGVEATTRVLNKRLMRNLASNQQHVESVERAYNRSRPSKAYTLQCMMPNVASGRAALLHNLRGANFVVDSGDQSLDAALLAASLLLEDGGVSAKIAVVAAVSACSGSNPNNLGQQKFDEHASAFALTTKAIADQYGWKPLIGLGQVRQHLQETCAGGRDQTSSSSQLRSLIERIRGEESKKKSSFEARPTAVLPVDETPPETCPIHTPVWVEKSLPEHVPVARELTLAELPAALFVVQNDTDLVFELLNAIPQRFSRSRVIVIGGDATRMISQHAGHDLNWVETLDSSEKFLDLVQGYSADLIVAVQRPRGKDFRSTLKELARDNTACEALFLTAKQEIARLNAGEVELWSLVIDGWSGEVHPCSGATAGLLKSICREIPFARMATLCTRGMNAAQSLDGLLREIAHRDLETEVVLDSKKRLVRRLMPVGYQALPQPQVSIDAHSVVIASGGARGVTAVMLEAIIRDFGCTVIALGRSALETGPEEIDSADAEREFYHRFSVDHPHTSPIEMRREFESTRARWEAARNIQFLRSIGGRVEYHVVDVTDSGQVSSFVADIAKRYGRVDLLIHGAGVQFSKKLQHRSLSEFRKTYQVKVRGLHLLADSCCEQFGKMVATHVLTSAYSIFGNDGQHDYCAANETMDRLCAASRQTIASLWSSLAWLAWEGVGMTRGSEYRALAKQRSLSGVDEATGQRLFRAVISGRTGVAINVPLSPAEHSEYRVSTLPNTGDALPGRWIEVPIDLNEIACLPYHQVREAPTLPGAWILHYFVEAAQMLCPESKRFNEVCIQQIAFQRFVKCQNGQSPNLRVIARKTDESIDVWMIADLLHSSGQLLAKDVRCASAKLMFRSAASQSRTLEDPGFDMQAKPLDDPYCRLNSMVKLSGPFRCLTEISIGHASRRAVFDDDCIGHWTMATPSLALDAAWRVGAMYADACKNTLFVPVSIGEVILPIRSIVAPTHPKRWTIVSTCPRVEQDSTRWTRTEVCDENGQIVILVKNAYAKPIQ